MVKERVLYTIKTLQQAFVEWKKRGLVAAADDDQSLDQRGFNSPQPFQKGKSLFSHPLSFRFIPVQLLLSMVKLALAPLPSECVDGGKQRQELLRRIFVSNFTSTMSFHMARVFYIAQSPYFHVHLMEPKHTSCHTYNASAAQCCKGHTQVLRLPPHA
jgi:hypothetical protein